MTTFLSYDKEENVDQYIKNVTNSFVEWIDEGVQEKGEAFFEDPEFLVYTDNLLAINWCSEWNVIDENGIILASTMGGGSGSQNFSRRCFS